MDEIYIHRHADGSVVSVSIHQDVTKDYAIRACSRFLPRIGAEDPQDRTRRVTRYHASHYRCQMGLVVHAESIPKVEYGKASIKRRWRMA